MSIRERMGALLCRTHGHAWRWYGPVARSSDPSWCARCPAVRLGDTR